MAERFEGFPPEALEFFDELELHNERSWFQAHKDRYTHACRQPMETLLAELEQSFGEWKIFRINRDVRFSKDKSPYKTHIGAVIGGNYLQLSTDGLYVGGGFYRPEPDGLRRFRAAVAGDATGPELVKIVASLERKGYEVGTHEKLKTAPKGYAKDHPRIELLRHKDLYAGKGFPPEPWFATRDVVKRVRKIFTDLKPLNAWLAEHVG